MDTSSSYGELITSTKHIQKILQRLIERATPLTIHPGDSSNLLTTYFEDVQLDNDNIIADAPLPHYRHALLQNRKLTLTTRYNGCLLTMVGVVMKPIENDDSSRYVASKPEHVYLLQRRQHFRAPVRSLLDIMVQFTLDDHGTISGRLKDVSVGGCCVELTGDKSQNFDSISDTFPLTLSFPNGSCFNFDMQVVRVHFNAQHNLTRIGCCFLNISAVQEQQINHLVADLQRDYICNQRNEGGYTEIPALFQPAQQKIIADAENNIAIAEPTQHRLEASIAKNSMPRVTIARGTTNEMAPIDVSKAYQSSITAVQRLMNHFRLDKPLPIEQALESCSHLIAALRQDRQGLILLTRQRNLNTYILQHSISYTVNFADIITKQYGEHINEELLTRVMLGGLCHNLAHAMLPDGIRLFDLELPEKFRQVYSNHVSRLVELLESQTQMSQETMYIVRDCQERLDGRGIPNGQHEHALNRVSKLAAALYAHEKLSHGWHQLDWHYHPLKAFKQLIDKPSIYHNPSVKVILNHYGKYPLGSTVKLSDQTLAMILRQDEQNKPTHLRVVYDLNFKSKIPPKDIILQNCSDLTIESPVNPMPFEISTKVLKASLKLD